jgi:hypothetical protein
MQAGARQRPTFGLRLHTVASGTLDCSNAAPRRSRIAIRPFQINDYAHDRCSCVPLRIQASDNSHRSRRSAWSGLLAAGGRATRYAELSRREQSAQVSANWHFHEFLLRALFGTARKVLHPHGGDGHADQWVATTPLPSCGTVFWEMNLLPGRRTTPTRPQSRSLTKIPLRYLR